MKQFNNKMKVFWLLERNEDGDKEKEKHIKDDKKNKKLRT
jgi:hypothetical protein